MLEKRTIAVAVASTFLFGQLTDLSAQKKLSLTIDNIMRGPGLYGYEPAAVRWSGDGQHVFFQWKQASDPVNHPLDTYVVNRDGSGLRKLGDEESRLVPQAAGSYTRDHKKMVYAMDGDLFLYDFSADKGRRLTHTFEPELNPHFTRDEQRVAFTRTGNLYTLSLETGMLEQVTNIVPFAPPPATPAAGGGGRGGRGGGAPPTVNAAETRGTDSQEFLKKQERELIATVRDRAKLREENEAKRKKEFPQKPFQLQQRQVVSRLDLCPDEKCVIALITENGTGAKPENVPSYVNESAYTEDIPGRTNVGDTENHARIAILDAETGEVKWADPGLDKREVQMQPPLWSEDGTKAVVIARALDNKDRWILALDPSTGKTRILFTEHDDAWLNNFGAQMIGWLKNSNEIYFESERDGYAHLYKVAFDSGEPKQLTSGKFEV